MISGVRKLEVEHQKYPSKHSNKICVVKQLVTIKIHSIAISPEDLKLKILLQQM